MSSYDTKRAGCAIIYRSELDYISRCILDYRDIETGGELFGFWTRDAVPVVLFALGPGPKANHQVTFFNQDVDYLLKVGRLLAAKYGLQHIGEWHSHHQLGLAHPSGHDAETMTTSIRERGLGRFLMALGNCDEKSSVLNAFEFVQEYGLNYRHIPWEVKEVASPFREVIETDRELSSFLTSPATRIACYGQLLTTKTEGAVPSYPEGYWLRDPRNHAVLKDISDGLSVVSDSGSCRVFLTPSSTVALSFVREGSQECIEFGEAFPIEPPKIDRGANANPGDLTGEWLVADDLAESVLKYYRGIQGRVGA